MVFKFPVNGFLSDGRKRDAYNNAATTSVHMDNILHRSSLVRLSITYNIDSRCVNHKKKRLLHPTLFLLGDLCGLRVRFFIISAEFHAKIAKNANVRSRKH